MEAEIINNSTTNTHVIALNVLNIGDDANTPIVYYPNITIGATSELFEEVSTIKCIALVKHKYTNESRQCSNKRKNEHEFCGVHIKCKKIIRYDVFVQNANTQNVTSKVTMLPVKKINNDTNSMIAESMNDSNSNSNSNSKMKHKLKLFKESDNSNLPSTGEIKKWKVKDIRNHIKNRGINIDLNKKKHELCKLLGDHYSVLEKYVPLTKKIIKIQNIIRRFLVRRRCQCVNKTDIYTLDSILNIPSRYFLKLRDADGFFYGFDIRSFKSMVDANAGKVICNPYNWKEIGIKNMTKYNKRLYDLIISQKGLEKIEDIEHVISPEKEIEHYMIKVFHKFDMLDNYTDHKWFKNLTIHQLKKLYRECEDIWNYRAALTIEQKKQYIKHGNAFHHGYNKISAMVDNHKNKLMIQNILLKEFERFAEEGVTEGDKKTAVKLMIAGLTQVSIDAANSYPYLVWSLADPNE